MLSDLPAMTFTGSVRMSLARINLPDSVWQGGFHSGGSTLLRCSAFQPPGTALSGQSNCRLEG